MEEGELPLFQVKRKLESEALPVCMSVMAAGYDGLQCQILKLPPPPPLLIPSGTKKCMPACTRTAAKREMFYYVGFKSLVVFLLTICSGTNTVTLAKI